MKKKILLLLLIGTLLLTGCTFKSKPRQAALDFKNEYEQVNGKEIREGLKWRTLNIAEDNPYVKTTDDDIAKKIQNGETFYLYVGDHLCPWCRSVIEQSIKSAKENGVDEIFYIDFWDESCLIDDKSLQKVQNQETIDLETSEFEFFMMGLRKIRGFNSSEYEKVFGKTLPEKFISLFNSWEQKGLCEKRLSENDGRDVQYCMSRKGMLFLNRFLEELC